MPPIVIVINIKYSDVIKEIDGILSLIQTIIAKQMKDFCFSKISRNNILFITY